MRRILIPSIMSCLLGALVAGAQDAVEPAHFHHVRLNVTDPDASVKFYSKNFGAVPVNYRHVSKGLFTEQSFILLNKVDEPARHGPRTALSHIGWASTNGQGTYDWLKSQGVEFQTDIAPLAGNYGMYAYGPDQELVEVWTGSKNHRFDHAHLWANDVEAMCNWYKEHLGATPRVLPKPALKHPENIAAIWMGFMQIDNLNLVVFGKPDFESIWWPGTNYTAEDAPPEFESTKGYVVNHLAFSYRDIDPVFERMENAGVEIVEPISKKADVGHRSFFVMAPDKILVEIVEARPIPEGLWDE